MELLQIGSSPHIRSDQSVQSIMRDVLIGLVPASLVGIYTFGFRAALMLVIATLSSMCFEWIAIKLRKKESTIGDLSAAVTGLLIGLNLPAGAPFWLAVVASAFGILIVKQAFGGLGYNFMNPALGARVFVLISFTSQMTQYTLPFSDTVSSATPLAQMAVGEYAPIQDLIFGSVGGVIGETSALAILIGGVYLMIRKVIGFHIPVVYIGSVFILSYLFSGFDLQYSVYSLFGGGLFLGAFFMATDYATTPLTLKGQIIFALGAGVITTLIRLYGAYPEGVMFAIILMNVATPLIERYTSPKPFGRRQRS